MRYGFITAITLAALPAPVLAQDWRMTSSPPDPVYIDAESLSKSGNVISFWIKLVNTTPDKEGVAWRLQRRSVDCSQRTGRLMSSILYNSSGTVIRTYTWKPYEQEDSPIPPSSVGDTIRRALCGGGS